MLSWLDSLLRNALTYLYGITESYGLAIIVLTLIIKTLLYPLIKKQTQSMKGMQKLQPEMEKIKKKYKDNKEKQQQKMMELYKEHNINPAAGCLPLLVQMPILIVFYRVLLDWDVLQGVGFTIIPDLSEAFLPLAILTGATMFLQTYVQQNLGGGSPGGGAQSKVMMYVMPVFIVFIGLSLPSGVLLYWFTSNLIMLIQQYKIYQQPDTAKGDAS